MSSGHTQSPDQPGRFSRANLGHFTLPEPGDDVSLSQMPQLCEVAVAKPCYSKPIYPTGTYALLLQMKSLL